MASSADNLYVTYVDIDRDLLKIWGQRNRIGATYIERQLLQLLPEFNRTASPNPNRVHKGMFCFAKYTDDNYYRARVISRVQDDSVGVLFVDYGNRDIIKLSNIRIQEGNEGDVLVKMSEQAEEYYLAKVAAPPLGWTKEIVSEIRRDVCYDEFRYQIISHVGDQKILDIQFRDDDFSNYLVKKKLARPLSIPVQSQLILSYCRLVPNEVKHEELFRDVPRATFSPSAPASSTTLRVPLKPANIASDMNMQLNYSKTNNTVNFPGPLPPLNYPPPRHMKAQFQQMEQSIPKSSYYSPVSQISNQMPVDSISVQPVNPSISPLINQQLNQFYQMPENMGPCVNNSNSNIIEILAQQVKQYIAKDNAKSETEEEKTPHHYVNSVLEVGNTYKAIVSFIDDGPWSFSIQLMSSENELKKLMKELSSSELIPVKPPIILGHPCIGRRVIDGNLCRGVVVSISRTAVKVYFVDYGNTEDLPSSSIYELPPKFFKTEVLSQKFSLSGLKKVAYSDDIKKFFKEVVEDENLLVRVVSLEDDNLPTCELFVKEINIKRILNEKMRELKNSVLDDLPKVGDTENVLVTWVVSPQKFFVQLRKRDSDLKALKEELAQVATKGQEILHKQLCVGLKCVCLYESDGHWYRAVITSIDSESAITVFYVDYGNTETVNLSHLRTVEGPGLINKMANQAIQCCLKGFENQPFNEVQLANKLESLTLEYEFQMSVESSEKQLLCVNLYDNGNDIASSLLLTQSQKLTQTQIQMQPKVDDQETFSQSEGSLWDSPEAVKPAFPTKTEEGKKFEVDEFLEKKDKNFKGEQNRKKSQGPRSGQNFKNFQTPIRASRAHLKSRCEERENWRQESAFYHEKDNSWGSDQQKNWRSRGSKEFGDWDSNKPGENKRSPKGWEESNDSAERGGGFNQIRNQNVKEDKRVSNYGDKKFVDNRSKRFDGSRKPDGNEGRQFESNREWDSNRMGSEDLKKKPGDKNDKFGDRNEKFGDKNEKLQEKKSSRVPVKKENIAPPGSKFEERIIDIGSTERGIVTYYFSPDEFFVQLLAQEEDFKKMMKDIQYYYSDKCSIRDPVKAGDIVIAQFSFDKILYRAEVIKPSPVTVRYVDYGNREPVQPKGLWLVDKEFLRLPQQVVKCRLWGLQPVESDWPPPGSSIDKFFEFAEYKCTFLGKEGDMYEISMEAVENGKDIASEIIAAGFGRPLNLKLEIPETDYSLLQNQILRMYVSHVDSSSKFYVIVNPEASELIAEAISSMIDEKKTLSLIDWSSLHPKMPCLATTNGSSWYRGNIIKTDGNKAVVWLCDTGNSVELPKDKVKRIPSYLKSFQPQAVQCCLHGISSLDDEENFKKTVENKNYLVHILSVSEKKLSVILYDDEGYLLDFEKGGDVQLKEPIGQLPIITQRIPLVISHLESPEEIYIQRMADEDSLTNFLEQVTDFYMEEGEEIPEGKILEGTLVAARSKIYESWYRGRIISSSDEELEVFYIDYGNREVLPRENFKKLDPSFMGMNAFCRRLSFGVNFDQKNIEEINSKIWELCDNRDLLGYFKNRNGELILEIKANEENVTELLKLSGLISVSESNSFVETESVAAPSPKTFEQQSDVSEYRVFVSHIDCPNRFWVHKEALIYELQQLQEKLQRSCEFLPCKKDVMVGDIVASFFSGLWYRTRVTRVEGNSVTVQFIDYGNTSLVDLNFEIVMELTSDLIDVPVFATRCSLKGTWSENATSKFEEIILRSEDPVTLVTLEKGDPLVVDLLQNDQSIAEMLLNECMEFDAEEVVDTCTVYITHCVSPREFYVQRESCTTVLNELTERLLDAQNLEDPSSVEENRLYAAKYPEDGAWYRARVTGKSGNSITVHFVDYGNTSTITEIKTLPSDLIDIPNLSENCSLVYGNNCDSWSDAACNLFAEYADGRALQMKVIARGAKRAIVKMYHDEKDISEELGALCESDGRVDMYVSHAVSPTDFYIQYVDDEKYKMIAETLSGEDDCENLDDRTEGTLCQACFIEDGCWYRARILQDLGEEGCEVFFIDFGNTSISEELRKLPKEIEDIPPRALKCRLDLKSTIVTESMREDFINLTAGGGAVFRGRIISPGETNVITLKLNGRILEETLNLDITAENDEKNLKCDAEDDTKSDDEENDSDKQKEEEQSPEADTSERNISFGEETTEDISEETEPRENENKNVGSRFSDSLKKKESSRNKVHKIVPESISLEERVDSVSENVEASFKAVESSEKSVPGSISRGISLQSVSEEVAGAEDSEKKLMSQSAPNTPRPIRKREYVKVDVSDKVVPGCISTGISLDHSPPGEKNGSQ